MEPNPPSDGGSRRKRRQQSSVSAVRPSETASSPGELGSMRPGAVKGSSSFVGSGSGVYFVRTVQTAFARNYSRSSEAVDEDLVPGEDDRLQMQNPPGSLWNSEEVDFVSPDRASVPIAFEDLVRWSQSYFSNWHPPFPFLHAPSFLGLLEKVSRHGIHGLSIVDSMTVRSVLSISVADRRQMPKDSERLIPSNLIFNTIDDAISCLTPIMMQPSTLAGLQALVSIKIFLVSMLRLNAASRIGGLIVRIAFHLGLHRCPSRYKQFSLADADIRRRVFWTIYSLERYLSQSLGLPLDLKDDDIDVCYSDNELHQTESSGPVSKAAQPHDPRLLLLPAFLARHGRIKGLILELRHICVNHRTTDPDDVASVEAEISRWWNEAQDLLDSHYIYDDDAPEANNNSQNGDLLKASHKLLLVVQKHESTILLNRPVITSGYNTSLFAAAMQKCIGASKQIVSKVYQHLHDGIMEAGSHDGRISSPLFWPGFTWCVWMSGLILLYAASEGHYSIQIAQRESERCIKILETLSLRGSFWPGACASALKDLAKALSHKTINGSLEGPQGATSSRPQALQRVMSNSRINLNDTQKPAFRSLNGEKSADRTNHIPTESPISPAAQSLDSSTMNPRDSTENIQTLCSNNQSRAFTATPQNTETPSQSNLSDFAPSNFGLSYSNWQGIGMNFGQMPIGVEGQFDGFDDIFQLMDVSYQLSEQMYDPADVARY